MKTQAIILAAAVALVLSVAVRVSAEETTGTTSNMETRTPKPLVSPSPRPIKAKMELLQEDRQEKREEHAAKRSDNLTKECARVVENATKLIAKIQLRIDHAKAEGRNVDSAAASLATATSQMNAGKLACDQAAAKFDSVTSDKWSEQQPVVQEARKLAKEAKLDFMNMRKSLAAAIKAIHGVGSDATKVK